MKGLELIKEEIFIVAKKPWIYSFFDECVVEDRSEYPLAYAVYIEEKGNNILIAGSLHTSEDMDVGTKNGFVSHIKKYKPSNFKDTIFLLDIYKYFHPVDFEKAINKFHHPKSTTYEVIESILESSRGIILWHYQLENILNIFIQNRNEVTSIRKCINAKKADTFKILKKYRIDDTLTLEDFIWERMILDCVKLPNIYGASILYNLLS